MIVPPKPTSREEKVSLWRYMRLFRKDILSAQPKRLYRAKMAALRTPFFWSFMINQTDLIETVLRKRPKDFPKSQRVAEGFSPLMGQSVFITNGETWDRQRRIIDPAFEHGRLKDSFSTVCEAAEAASARMCRDVTDIEPLTSHAAADDDGIQVRGWGSCGDGCYLMIENTVIASGAYPKHSTHCNACHRPVTAGLS